MTVLRPLSIEDLTTLTVWRNDRQLRNGTQGFRFPIASEMDERWYQTSVIDGPPQKAVFAIQSADGTLQGIAQLTGIDAIHRHAELGIFLGNTEARGQGLGKRAIAALLEYGFQDLNLRRVFLRVTADNTAAIKLYKSEGFVEEGCLKQHYFQDGDYFDVLLFALFRDS